MATAARFVSAALAERGYTENPPGSNRTKFADEAGHPNGYAWCHTFCVAIGKRVGLDMPAAVAATAYTPSGVTAWKAAGRWGRTPQSGDWGYLNFDSDAGPEHVAIVVSVLPDGRVHTIEGNTSATSSGSQSNGGGVYERYRAASLFIGFGRPHFTAPSAPTPEEPDVKVDPRIIVVPPVDDQGKQVVGRDEEGKSLGVWAGFFGATPCASNATGKQTKLHVEPYAFGGDLVLSVANLDGTPALPGRRCRVLIARQG